MDVTMLNVTKEQIETLVLLQKIDSESRQIESELKRLPDRNRELDDQLAAFEQQVDEKKAELEDLRKRYREMDGDVKTNQASIRKSNEKLVSVKTNKEYHAILKEIDETRKKNSAIEDEMIESLDRIEAAEKAVAALMSEFETLKNEISEERRTIEQENAASTDKLTALQEDRQKVSTGIPAPLLTRFQLVSDQANGLAVVPVVDAVCKGCHMNIPPQMYNELQRCDILQFCPHCHRIVYWNGNPRS